MTTMKAVMMKGGPGERHVKRRRRGRRRSLTVSGIVYSNASINYHTTYTDEIWLYIFSFSIVHNQMEA